MTATVAAFDFDGTITRRDSLLPFLRRLVGAQRLSLALSRNGLHLTRMLAGQVDRDAVKEKVVGPLLAGITEARAREVAQRYAEELVRRQRFRPHVLERARQHRAAGHEVVIVSASPSLYLEPLGAALGFDAVLATELEVVDGRLTGRLLGANCRGAEKVARLDAWIAGRAVRLWAYGDSSGDAELLARADVACHVRQAPLAAFEEPLR